MSTATIFAKNLYTCFVCVMTALLLISFGLVVSFTFNQYDFSFAIVLLIFVSAIYLKFFSWLKRITYLKYKNNTFIVKGAFNKTILTPAQSTDIETVLNMSEIALIRIQFALDGNQYSYFSFSRKSVLKNIKKGKS